MGDLRDFKLYFEKLEEGKQWLADTVVRIAGRSRGLPAARPVRAVQSQLARDVPALRIFKRIHLVESKLDKPFLYESELLRRIEVLEDQVLQKKS